MTAPSPAATSAPASPRSSSAAQDDETLRACENCAARLRAAEARVQSLEAIIADKDRQLAAKEEIITAKNEVIATYKSIDRNSQQMDANSQRMDALADRAVGVLQQQIAADARRITEMQSDLERCQGSRPWIALGSAIGGGYIGYKLRGAQQQFLPQGFPGFFTNSTPPFTQPAAQPVPQWMLQQQPAAPDLKTRLEQLRRGGSGR